MSQVGMTSTQAITAPARDLRVVGASLPRWRGGAAPPAACLQSSITILGADAPS